MDRSHPALVQSGRVTLQVEAARIRARCPLGLSTVAIVLDGVVQAIVNTTKDGFVWDIPAHVFGRLLDVVSVEDGSSLLAEPVTLDAVRAVRWQAWMLRGRRITGSFEADGTQTVALPVALVGNGRRYAEGFARRREGGTFAFDLEISRLPQGIEGVALQPVVGGLLLTPVLLVPAEAFGYVGFLEPSEPWRVRGWAVVRERLEERVSLDVYVDGRLAASLVADKPREAVAASGVGDGSAGFDGAGRAPLDRVVTIDVRVAGGPSLGGSPFIRPAAPRYVGYFDGVDGFSAGGWAIDLAALDQPVRVEALCDGEIVGAGLADLYRGDVAEAGLPTARCGFHLVLTRPAGWLIGREVVLTIAGTGLALQGSPRQIALNPNVAAFLERRVPSPAMLTRLRRRLTHRVRDMLISIVMPVHETRREWLIEAIGSVVAQWSDNWELICIDDGSAGAQVQEVLCEAARDDRVRVVRREPSGGIARAVNAGLQVARGEYVAFLDHDDALEPDAIYHLARAVQKTGAGLIYSDEVLTGPSLDQVVQHRARPAWSHDYYLSHPYFVHLVAVRRELALAIGGYDESMPISADVDFVLRAVERAETVTHVPRVLYRWRTHSESAGHQRRNQVMAATEGAIGRHLERLGQAATVRAGLGFNQFRVDWPDDGEEVLIVIPTKDRVDLLQRCIESVEATVAKAGAGERYRIVVVDHQSTDPASVTYLNALSYTVLPYAGPFNFASMNNLAVRAEGGTAKYLLFLNNDVEAIGPGWLGRMRSLAGRPEVGAVRPLLLYGNGQVQHAGVIVGFGGTADHAMRFAELNAPDGSRNSGYNANLTSVRDYSAVTAACMMVRRTVFEQVGGFDEAFAVGFNDTDLCLRLRAAGYRSLYDGHTVLRHHESATRAMDKALADPTEDDARFKTRWPAFFDGVDPFYNPWLTTEGADHRLRSDAGRHIRLAPRVFPSDCNQKLQFWVCSAIFEDAQP